MNKEAVFHEAESNYSFPISRNEVVLRIRVSRNDYFDDVSVIYGMKYDFHQKQNKIKMIERYRDTLFKYYELRLSIEDVRFVYVFSLQIDGNQYYFCEDGVVDNYDFNFAYYNCFQIPYINESDIPKKVSWMENAVFYEIFIDRFNRGDYNKDDSYINSKWGETPKTKSFYGGDIKGIMDKLEYLHDLGVNALYLTPIFESISNHKYDISNYYKIDNHFGDEIVFKDFVDKAHQMGIKIILDGVFNHTSDLLLEFQDVVKKGKESRYFDWFIIHGDKVDKKAVNYETFANCYYHPKFNTSNLEVRKYLIDVAKHYIKKYDIDGWRLDVSDEVSHNFWFHFREEIKALKPDALLVGENWHDAKSFLRGDQFDSIMNYAVTKALLDFFAYKKTNAAQFSDQLNKLIVRNNSIANSMMLNLLDTHDTYRFFTEVNKNIDSLEQALAVLFMHIGVPCLYYGVEIPLIGGYDPDNRRCFEWNSEFETTTHFRLLKQLIQLRKNDCVSKGEISIYDKNGLFLIDRIYEGKIVRLYVNNTGQTATIKSDKTIIAYKWENDNLSNGGFLIVEVKE